MEFQLGEDQRVNGVQIVILRFSFARSIFFSRAPSCRTFLSSASLPAGLGRNLSTYLSDVPKLRGEYLPCV